MTVMLLIANRVKSFESVFPVSLWFLAVCFSLLAERSFGAPNGEPLKVEVLNPREGAASYTREFIHVLGRSSPSAKVTVNGQPARVFHTGIFVRDGVQLSMGENRIPVVASEADGRRVEKTVVVNRLAEAAPKVVPQGSLHVDNGSVEPSANMALQQGDVLEVSFRGTPGQQAEFRWNNGDWRVMAELTNQGASDSFAVYRGLMVVGIASEVPPSNVQFRLRRSNAKPADSPTASSAVEFSSPGRLGVWDLARVRVARVNEDGAGLSYGLHEVRLGGPYICELTRGTLLRVTGMQGNHYRVRLSSSLEAWIHSGAVEWAAEGTPVPHLAFTSVSVSGGDSADSVAIPYSAPVPFSVTPVSGSTGRGCIQVDFFGAHHAATWISHRSTARVVREVTVQQPGTDHLRLCVELNGSQIWGYQWTVTNGSLLLKVRPAPLLAAAPESPLKGLTVALEPGHGGNNSGARGVSGSLEKDVNRLAVEDLAQQLQGAGARVVVVREGDQDPSLAMRARRAVESNSHLFISVHANAASQARGYLAVSGTSTYYKWPFSRDFAAAIHKRLLEITGLPDFGNVGNFNYYPIRANTWMPAMLVEQAFMSNPEDEAKMLDPAFRREMMRAVLLGAEDWLRAVRSGAEIR